MSFFSHLEARCLAVDSLLCIGLDPHPGDLPENTPQAAGAFCRRLIAATAPVAAAFKPNAAFFEALGPEGLQVLRELIAGIPAEIPVILDAKRGDIASTAQAYARAAFETLGARGITASPYLGRDSLEPMLQDPERGVFVLCKTSNPGASDFQDLIVETAEGKMPLFEVVARRAEAWNQAGNLGVVVGATQPEALQRVREAVPAIWILAPGVGAQGGDLETALRLGLREDGLGMLVPVSRAVARAKDPRQAAEALRLEINRVRKELVSAGGSDRPSTGEGIREEKLRELADGLLEAGCVRFGRFTLKSGLESPVYMDLRLLTGHPALLQQAAAAYRSVLDGLRFDRLAALPYAALPIGTAVSLLGGWPMIYPRKEVKEYGTRAEVEGPYRAGERAVVVDDLATTGGSKFEAIEKLAAAGLEVEDVVVLIDRQSGAAEALASRGYRLHAVFTLTWLLEYWEQHGQVSAEQAAAVRQFLQKTS